MRENYGTESDEVIKNNFKEWMNQQIKFINFLRS